MPPALQNEMHEPCYIVHEEKQILLIDFTGLSAETLDRFTEKAIALARSSNTKKSVLAMIDLTNTGVNRITVAALKTLSAGNGPYIRALTFVGLSPFWHLIVQFFLYATKRRNHAVIKEREQAIAWLSKLH